jgi:hypothetical protein
VSGQGTTLTINVALTFKSPFTGAKTSFAIATDAASQSSGWQVVGTWTVP